MFDASISDARFRGSATRYVVAHVRPRAVLPLLRLRYGRPPRGNARRSDDRPGRSFSPKATLLLVAVLVRSLNPHERLNVDHVSRTKVVEIAADGCRELQKPTIGFPRWPRLITKIEVI